MKKYILRRLIAMFVVALMTLGATMSVMATEARMITVHSVEGDNAELVRGVRGASPRVGQRLAQGNTLTTGRDTQVYLLMDSDSVMKMDQQSQIVVSSVGNRLALAVQSGSALLDVGTQQAGHTTEVRIGNTGLTVRGTMFTASRVGDNSVIHMLSGLGEVEQGFLRPGYTMVVTQRDGGDISRIYPTVFEELDSFTLQAITDNAEYLSTYGIVTPELLDALPALKEQAETRENAIQASVDRALDMVFAGINDTPTTETPTTGTDENNSGDGGQSHPPAITPPGSPDTGSGTDNNNPPEPPPSYPDDNNNSPEPPPSGQNIRDFESVAGTLYTIGELVRFEGRIYEVRQTFVFWGDPNWLPGITDSLWLRRHDL
ncbi:MAG: FecR domain-containing protein [Defluviitaleaceae bacterium]|nr:FecR domain-containing protein [Defluviitaleaceae bacterium]